jgi:hypothetical protein
MMTVWGRFRQSQWGYLGLSLNFGDALWKSQPITGTEV